MKDSYQTDSIEVLRQDLDDLAAWGRKPSHRAAGGEHLTDREQGRNLVERIGDIVEVMTALDPVLLRSEFPEMSACPFCQRPHQPRWRGREGTGRETDEDLSVTLMERTVLWWATCACAATDPTVRTTHIHRPTRCRHCWSTDLTWVADEFDAAAVWTCRTCHTDLKRFPLEQLVRLL